MSRSRTDRALTALSLILLALGCGDAPEPPDTDMIDAPTPPPTGALIDPMAWREAGALDPFPDHRPREVRCDRGSVLLDPGFLDVSTESCDYVLITQPLLRGLRAGEVIEIESGHLILFNPDGDASGHMALGIDGQLIWEREVLIPAGAQVYFDSVTLAQDFPAGAQLTLHLHNHGANEWRLYDVRAAP